MISMQINRHRCYNKTQKQNQYIEGSAQAIKLLSGKTNQSGIRCVSFSRIYKGKATTIGIHSDGMTC